MAKTTQFDAFDQFSKANRSQNTQCLACEEMLADALDEALTQSDQAWFDRHMTSCVACSQMVTDAKRGAAWLEMLKTSRPEPSVILVERILAQTSGFHNPASTEYLSSPVVPVPFSLQMPLPAAPATRGLVTRGLVLPFRPRIPHMASFDPRLAMTAAMAFFSIALTLNLSGVRLNELHASNLKAANLKRTYYEANAQAIRFYDGLRVVRVMESRVEDLREATGGREATGRDDTPRGRDAGRSPESLHGQPEQGTPKPEAKEKPETGKGMSFQQPLLVLPKPVQMNEPPSSTQLIKGTETRPEGGLA